MHVQLLQLSSNSQTDPPGMHSPLMVQPSQDMGLAETAGRVGVVGVVCAGAAGSVGLAG